MRIYQFFVGCCVFFAGVASLGQIQQPDTIHEIQFRGLSRVSEQFIRSQIELKVGEGLASPPVSRDIRRLTDLGFFSHIRVELEKTDGKNIVVYIFKEELIIDRVNITGNKKLKDRELRGAIAWKEGDSFIEEAFEEELEKLLLLYRSKGFLNATVDIYSEKTGESRVQITYLIDEGKKAKIKKVRFVGNDAVKDRKLKRTVKTGKGFLFIGGRYDQVKFEEDIGRILDVYGDVGHLEADIPNTDFDFSKKGKKVDITIHVDEGPEYHVDQLEVAGNYVFTSVELGKQIETSSGDVHNKTQVTEDALAVKERYKDNGYVSAGVNPIFTLDRENHTTNVIHQVREGDLKYIREIRVSGNSKTKDEVIRRNLLLHPGERYDGSLYRDSLNRINRTQFFSDVRPSIEPVEDNDHFADILFDVDEGKTGNFNFGMGFNTDEGAIGFGELQLTNFDITNWPNFSGGGQLFNARFSIGDVRTNFRLGFTDPQFMGHPITFGVDLFNDRFRSRGGSTFTIENKGGQIRLAKAVSNHVTLRTVLRYDDVTITDLATFVDPNLRPLDDPGLTISNTFGIHRDTSDHYRDPTEGSSHDLAVEIAGLSGDNEFATIQHESVWFYGLKKWEKWAFSVRTREAVATTYGSSDFVPLSDRFYAGGSNTLRGYDSRDVGPKAKTFRDVDGNLVIDEQAIGGHFRLIGNIEAKYIVNEMLRLYVFGDGGGVWMEPGDFDTKDLRYSVGVGFGLQVPFLGPLRIDYGFPLNPDDDQGSGQLHLQTSLRF